MRVGARSTRALSTNAAFPTSIQAPTPDLLPSLMEPDYDFDLCVLGAGSGGTRAARFAATKYGVRVACVELPFGFVSSESVGGAGGT